ncbi:endo-1,4-beta-xylanase [Caldicellulosiruptor acetigenus]|uniref:Beta-xylanase n=1 Tax=Caldicellulosiruptor acetigenus 6A TaxID=632516 RepID=G2PWE2_9FIRM|nr:endo-1,4-beta-xylanase [Caldicellulosiruptor acetigenus]AEM72886.1 glycoside hydrolase family 10 [Caldicellulosiruptor acetigenus 6A]
MRKRAIALFVTLIFVMSILSPGYLPFLSTKANAQTQNTPTILRFDFESGNQGWTGRGLSTTVATVYNVAYEGDYSLKVSGKNASWDGAVIDLTDKLSANVSYTVSLFVHHSDPKPQRFSIYAYVKDSASEKYIPVVDKVAVPNYWKQLVGKFTINTSNPVEKLQLLVCVPTSRSLEFFIDSVVIASTASVPSGVVKSTNFESGTTEGWQARGTGSDAQISVVSTIAHTGSKSLYVTGRVQTWQGAQIDLTSLLEKGKEYQFSVWVYQDSGSDQKLTLTMQRKNADGSTNYDTIKWQQTVSSNTWVELTGSYTVPTTATQLIFYIESPNATLSFYIDDFTAVDKNAPVVAPGVVKSATFEGGTTEDWQARGNGVTISVVNTVAHNGSKSLYVTGRSSTWHGAQIDLTSVLEKGKDYQFSVWVYQDSGSDQKLTLTMQRQNADGTTNYDSIKYQQTVATNTWVELTGSYTVPTTATQLILYVEAADTTLSFYIDDFTAVDKNPEVIPTVSRVPEWEIPSLFEQYTNYFSIGVAIPYKVLTNPTEKAMVLKHFNSITAENEMKPDAIQKTEGNFTFNVADQYVDFAQQNRIGIRGHTLVWHQQTPNCFFQHSDGTPLDPSNPADKQLLRDRLRTHIQTLVGRYAGKIYAWDVVNEAIDENQPDGYRRSEWYRILGPTDTTDGIPEYILLAFQYAREADPNTKLFYNDYNTENPKKRQFIYNLVKKLKERGLIDGVGLQCHINVDSPTVKEIEDTIKLFSTIPGLDIHITELDISVYTSSSQRYDTLPQDIMIKQALKFKELFEMLKRYSYVVTNVTFWGLKDDYSWLSTSRPDWPLLFDNNYQAKYNYWAIVEPSVLPLAINKGYANNASARIDGVLDREYKGAIPIKITNESGQEVASVQALWNPNELSLYISVNDTTIDAANDKVVVFVDQDNGKMPEIRPDDYWVSVTRTGAKAQSAQGYVKDYAVVQQANGYVVELKLLINNTLTVNSSIGFDVAIFDNEVQYSWNDKTNSQFIETDNYGILTMADSVKFASAPKGKAIIDAELDDTWKNAQEITTDTKVTVTGTVYDSAYAKAKMMWDENSIYVYAIVYDPLLNKANTNPWEQDSIEIFVDENNHKTPYYENDDVQYRVNYENTQTFGTNGAPQNFITATKIIPNGYIVEAKVYMRTTKLSEGMVIGFDIQVNDADHTGKRVGVLTWNDKVGNNYRDTTKFGCLELVAAPVSQPPIQAPSPSQPTTITYILTPTPTQPSTQTQQQPAQQPSQQQQQPQQQQPAQTQQPQTQPAQKPQNVVSVKIDQTKTETFTVGADTKVVVPQGSVTGANAIVTVEKVAKLENNVGIGAVIATPVKVSIESGNIAKPIQIELKVDPAAFKDDRIPIAFVYDDSKGKWTPVATKKAINTVTVATTKAGTVAVVAVKLEDVYKDISKEHWAYNTFKQAITSGLIVGYEDMTLKPAKNVTFAEAAVVAQRAFEITPKDYNKLANVPDWASLAVKSLIDNEIVTEIDNVNKPLTRIEAVSIIMKLLEKAGVTAEPAELEFSDLFEQSSIDVEYLSKAYKLGIVKGYTDGTFRPQNTITRAELLTLLIRALNYVK